MPAGIYTRKVRDLIRMDDHVCVPLTRGMVAIIDYADIDNIKQYNWNAQKYNASLTFYARCSGPRENGRRKFILMHRLILNLQEGSNVDHVNGNGLDNRRCNLRIASKAQNQFNRGKCPHNTSGYKGVSWYKRNGTWQAHIKINGIGKTLGNFSSPEDAARAYDAAARKHHGEFARLNFPA